MPNKGYKASKEHIERNRKAKIKMWKSPDFRKKVSIIYKNSIPRKRWLKKLHKFSKGKHYSPETEFKKGQIPANFKGRTKHSLGYIWIYSPKHPHRDKSKNVLEHRLIVENQIKRYLTSQEMVHHINGITDDNRPENLMAFTKRVFHIRFELGKDIPPTEIIFDGRKL